MDIIGLLQQFQTDPAVYLIIFFLFSLAAAIFLPIPIEIGLILNPSTPYFLKAIVLGLGKGVGSLAVLGIGMKLEPRIRSWQRWAWFRKFFAACESFVAKYNYYALFVLLSIPLMTDTVPLYLFSLMNKEGKTFTWKRFFIVNFLAGLMRATILYVLLEAFGINLFG